MQQSAPLLRTLLIAGLVLGAASSIFASLTSSVSAANVWVGLIGLTINAF
ncbi:hypothetical protein [Deinococcus sp.]|nr:hypothetical protein [Deinococcus sp.]